MSQGAADILGRGGGRLGTPLPEQLPRRTVRQNAQSLAAVPLFAGFSSKHLKRLASQSDELAFEPREPIVEEGMLGETLFVVLNGRGKVTRRGTVHSWAEKEEAERAAWAAPGVSEVDNQIVVEP